MVVPDSSTSNDSANIESISDTACYSISEVAERTNVNPITLRAWERRYGILAPQRNEGGRRLYSEKDVQIINALLTLQQQGHSISNACEKLRSSDNLPPASANNKPVATTTKTVTTPSTSNSISNIDTVSNAANITNIINTANTNANAENTNSSSNKEWQIAACDANYYKLMELAESKWQEHSYQTLWQQDIQPALTDLNKQFVASAFLNTWVQQQCFARLQNASNEHNPAMGHGTNLLIAGLGDASNASASLLFALQTSEHGYTPLPLGLLHQRLHGIEHMAEQPHCSGIVLYSDDQIAPDFLRQQLPILTQKCVLPIFFIGKMSEYLQTELVWAGGIPLGNTWPKALASIDRHMATRLLNRNK
ncbi:MAG: MerR family transcriptional regulator [Mariprofundales bacterium]